MSVRVFDCHRRIAHMADMRALEEGRHWVHHLRRDHRVLVSSSMSEEQVALRRSTADGSVLNEVVREHDV